MDAGSPLDEFQGSLPGRSDIPSGSVARSIFRFVVFSTFIAAFILLLLGIALSLDPSWGSALSQGFPPYFFVLIIAFVSPSEIPIFSIFIIMFALYLVFFSTMIRENRRNRDKDLLDTPIGFFIGVATAVLVVVEIISILEIHYGTPIGGSGIEQQITANPLLGYMELIYAPFVEELGFRIIPLGLFSFFLVRAASRGQVTSYKDALLAIVLPGHIRRKYNLSLGKGDWILIVLTSIIFGYAHILYGEWSWGKFLPVFITGIALAIGFLKFGAYVDIPFHWFFNGLLTLYFLNPSLTLPMDLMTLWLLVVGFISIVAILAYTRNYISRGKSRQLT